MIRKKSSRCFTGQVDPTNKILAWKIHKRLQLIIKTKVKGLLNTLCALTRLKILILELIKKKMKLTTLIGQQDSNTSKSQKTSHNLKNVDNYFKVFLYSTCTHTQKILLLIISFVQFRHILQQSIRFSPDHLFFFFFIGHYIK